MVISKRRGGTDRVRARIRGGFHRERNFDKNGNIYGR